MIDETAEAGSPGAQEPDAQPRRFTQNVINKFFTCTLCHEDKPRGVSPQEYSRLDVGFTDRGLQVWCRRHQVNIVHLDFEGKTLRGSAQIDVTDMQAFQERMPDLVKAIEANRDLIVQAGRAVLQQRLSAVGLRDDPTTRPATDIATPGPNPAGTTYRELLGAFTIELDRYLSTGSLPPDWAQALQLLKAARGEGILLQSP